MLSNDKGIVITFLWGKTGRWSIILEVMIDLETWMYKHKFLEVGSTTSHPTPNFLVELYHKIIDHSSKVFDTLISNFWMCTLRLGSRVRSGWSFLRRVIFPPKCNSVRVLAPKAILVLTVSTCHPKFASWLLVWVQLLGDWLGCWKKSLEKQKQLMPENQETSCNTFDRIVFNSRM